jgi:hypothetical protein
VREAAEGAVIRSFSRPDDGTTAWAEEEAAALLGVAMVRADGEKPPRGGEVLLNFSSFAKKLMEPRHWKEVASK